MKKNYIKNTIVFDSWMESQRCGRVLARIPSIYNQDIMNQIRFLQNKIWGKDENEDGTVRIRLTKEWTEQYGYIIADSIQCVKQMYKEEFADAFMKLFSCSEED